MKILEIPVQIGAGEGLSAVFSRPADIDASRPVFVTLNAGLLHRVGPFRLHVQLSRLLAQLGIPTLRLDLSGIGYSPKRTDLKGVDAAMEDMDSVFNWLEETYSLTRTVLMGSCAGAELSHRIAVSDQRVKGCVMLDGYAYRNTRSALHYYGARVHRATMWGKWISSQLRASEEEGQEEFWDSAELPLEQFRSDLVTLMARQVSLLYVYSGSVREYTYAEQFFDLCPGAREGDVTVRYFRDADHTYLIERDRRELLDSICHWAQNMGDPADA